MSAARKHGAAGAHTPGPWRVDGGRCGPNSDRLMVCHGGEDEGSPILAEVLSDYAKLPREANARLIAASPDLLESSFAARHQLMAVLGCVSNAEHRRHIERAIDLATTAITKAGGQSTFAQAAAETGVRICERCGNPRGRVSDPIAPCTYCSEAAP